MENLFLSLGSVAAIALIAAMVWSSRFPERRVWPPENFSSVTPLAAWGLVILVFGCAIGLGLLGWGDLNLPGWVRWGIGIPLVVLGNIAAWRGAFRLGAAATSGAEDSLVTTGLYKYSRNPQYMANCCILIGIGLVTSSILAWPVIVLGIIVFFTAPLAEEPWLRERYGVAFERFCNERRRYF